MADPSSLIEDQIDKILSQQAPGFNFFKPRSSISNTFRDFQNRWQAVSGLNTMNTLFNLGSETTLSYAYDAASNMLQQAIQNGDSEGIALWSSLMDSAGQQLQAMYPTDDGSGGGSDPYADVAALSHIYQTAVDVGTMKGDAAAAALDAALEQAQLTDFRDYLPGWEPYGRAAGALWHPMGGIGDAGKFTKVQVADPSSITDATDAGFNEVLAALMGAIGSSGGGSGAAGTPQPAPAPAPVEDPPVEDPFVQGRSVGGTWGTPAPSPAPKPPVGPSNTNPMTGDPFFPQFGQNSILSRVMKFLGQ